VKIKVAVMTLLLGLGGTEAAAQPGWYRPFAEVSPYAVVRILRARGLVPVSRPALVGRNYVVQATDRTGDLKRVVVDAAYGDIVRVISLNRPPTPQAPPASARSPRPLDDDDVATLAPGPIPARPRTAAVTPLPRPRPPLAVQGPVVPTPDPSEQPMSKPDMPAETPAAAELPPVTTAAPAPRVVLPGALGTPAARPESPGESRGVTLPIQPPGRGTEPPAAPDLPPVQPLD